MLIQPEICFHGSPLHLVSTCSRFGCLLQQVPASRTFLAGRGAPPWGDEESWWHISWVRGFLWTMWSVASAKTQKGSLRQVVTVLGDKRMCSFPPAHSDTLSEALLGGGVGGKLLFFPCGSVLLQFCGRCGPRAELPALVAELSQGPASPEGFVWVSLGPAAATGVRPLLLLTQLPASHLPGETASP